jgi:prophage regulatory protein
MNQSATPPTATEGTNRDLSMLAGPIKQALLRPAMACAVLGISRTGLHRLSENDPTFPRKIVLSKRCVGYRAESLNAWLKSKELSL